MNWNDYKKAVDGLPFDPDFQARTIELLRRQAREPSKKECMTMKRKTIQRCAAIAAAIALLTVSAYAAVTWLSPSQVADELGQTALAEAFESETAVFINQSVETGDYRVTLAGLVSGRGLSGWQQDLDQSRTYAVASVERLDGAALSADDLPPSSFILTPLVSGYTPWSLNNWTLDAGVSSMERDGVIYYLLDVENLEKFADHTVYLAFYEGGSPSQQSFTMAADGTIAFAEGYEGPRALFILPLDVGRADPDAVEKFIADSGFDREWFVGQPSGAEEPPVPESGEQDAPGDTAGQKTEDSLPAVLQ